MSAQTDSQEVATAPVWQITTEAEAGVTLQIGGKRSGTSEPWSGYRVRYRLLGSRGRWEKFLTDDNLEEMSVADLQAFCTAHHERGRR